MQRFLISFVLLLLTIFTFSQIHYVQKGVIEPFTGVLAWISAVAIRPGCNGVEATLLLWAAMLAFPATGRARLIGIVAGMLTIQILNQARIVSLFYLGQWNQTVFDWAHLYLWPALIILDALVVFLVWVYINSQPEVDDGL